MKKLVKFISGLYALARNPWLMNHVLDDDSVNKRKVSGDFNIKDGLQVIDILDLFPQLDETIEPFGFLEGGSLPTDLALLKGLVKKAPHADYLEIGTWRGESVSNVAPVASHCITINLPDDEMEKMGLGKGYINQHRFFSNHLTNVTHLQANSLTFDFSSLNKKFDVVFVDGDHHYESVKSDTENAFRILKPGGVIVWHDYTHDTINVRWDVLRGILEGTPKEKRKNLFQVSNTLCALYTEQSFSCSLPDKFNAPKKHFKVNIKAVPYPNSILY